MACPPAASNDPNDDLSVCHFPDDKEFVRVCRDAEAQARRTGSKAHFWWRGYRGTVAANLPPITVPGLKVRLMNALQKVNDKSPAETMVIIILIKKKLLH